jgi:ABC-type Mn2+/Zn2+ transport system ATPase subunit
VVRLDVRGRDGAFARLGELQHHVVAVVQLEHDALEVQQDVDHVLLHAVEGGVLVQHAGDLDFRGRVAGHRRQEHAAQRVTQRVPVAALERLHHHLGMERRHALHVDDAGLQENIALHAVPFGESV